jgi:chorismate dehydratase
MRVGAVSYLNTKPLIEFMSRDPRIEMELDLPSRLADRLRTGGLDVGLIPVAEVFQQAESVIIPDACIACWGPVWSVKLMSRVPMEAIRTLQLDEGSRTSVVLCQVLLYHLHGVRARTSSLRMGDRWDESEADAVLVIGDRAMRAASESFPHEWDLGSVWRDWTGLPFVFAVWAARRGWAEANEVQIDFLQEELNAARDRGCDRLDELTQRYASGYGLSDSECMKYLGEYLSYRLGGPQREALQRFHDLASGMGFVPPRRSLVYHECV